LAQVACAEECDSAQALCGNGSLFYPRPSLDGAFAKGLLKTFMGCLLAKEEAKLRRKVC
jgi:hypothetical protein